jgi:hypothetical protein
VSSFHLRFGNSLSTPFESCSCSHLHLFRHCDNATKLHPFYCRAAGSPGYDINSNDGGIFYPWSSTFFDPLGHCSFGLSPLSFLSPSAEAESVPIVLSSPFGLLDPLLAMSRLSLSEYNRPSRLTAHTRNLKVDHSQASSSFIQSSASTQSPKSKMSEILCTRNGRFRRDCFLKRV